MAQRIIHFDYFQLSAGENGNADIGELLAIKKKCKPIQVDGSVIVNFSKFHVTEHLIFGTLIKNQMTEIPATFDNANATFEPLHLNKNEGIAHPTSFIFDRDSRVLMYEASHTGVSLHNFCQFIEHNYKIPYIEPAVILNPEELRRLQRFHQISKIEVKIARVKNGTIFHDRNMPISSVIEAADRSNASTMSLTLSAGRSKSLADRSINDFIRSIKPYLTGNRSGLKEVKKMVVTGREEGDEKIAIDFIKDKFRSSITIEKRRQIVEADIYEKLRLMEIEYVNQKPLIDQTLD